MYYRTALAAFEPGAWAQVSRRLAADLNADPLPLQASTKLRARYKPGPYREPSWNREPMVTAQERPILR